MWHFSIFSPINQTDHPVPLDLTDPPRLISVPTDIKTMVTDTDHLYLGTSNGKVVTVPLKALKQKSHLPEILMSQELEEIKEVKEVRCVKQHKRDHKGSKEAKEASRQDNDSSPSSKESKSAKEREEMALRCLPLSAAAVHSHMDERVRELLFLRLPEMKLTKLKQAAEMLQYHSLPNLASPYGGRIPISPPIMSFRSLVISVGKGHVEYVKERGDVSADENSGIQRERHETFQLLVWGHKNTTTIP